MTYCVVHVITRLCQGGAAKVLATLGKYGGSDEFDLYLIYGQLDHGEIDAAAEVTSFFKKSLYLPELERSIHPLNDMRAFLKLRAYFRQLKPDIVHTHTSKAGILARLAAQSLSITCVHSTHGHIFNTDANIPGVTSIKRPMFLFAEKMVSRKTECIFTLSEGEIDDLVNLEVAKRDQFKMLSSPVDVEQLIYSRQFRKQIREKKNIRPDDWITIHVGRLAGEKGHEDLIRAMTYEVEGQLWIAGEGPLKEKLMQLTAQLGLNERVSFLGHCDDLHQWLSAIDVLVLPSTYEGQGLVLIEAMAAGVPVVATRVGGIPEIIDHNVNGIMVRAQSPHEIAQSIKKLQQDEELRAKLINNAQETVNRYHPEKIVKLLKQFYLDAIQQNDN